MSVVREYMAHSASNAVMLSHLAGLRVGEIAHLRVGEVVDANGKVRDRILLSKEITKGDEARTVFVSARLRRELDRFFQAAQSRPALDAPLLRTQKRTAFSPNTLCQWFTNLYRRTGIEGATSHSGCRWFITRLAHAGVSPKVIMTLAGHKHLTTTQRYIDVNDEMLRRAVEAP